MGSIAAVRLVMVVLTVALAVALIERGDALIGVLLLALAFTRVVLITRISQRRNRFRQRRPPGGPPGR